MDTDLEATAPGGQADRLLLRASAAAAGWHSLLVATTIAGAVVALARPAALAAAVDAATAPGGGAGRPLALFAAVSVAVLASAVVAQLTEACGAARITAWLRLRVVAHAVALGPAGGAGCTAGDLTSRAVTAAPHAAGLTPVVVDGLAGVALSVGACVALWLIDWRIVAAVGLAGPVAVVVGGLLVRSTTELTERYQAGQSEVAARFVAALRGARTIRACGTADLEVERTCAPLPEVAAAGHALWRLWGDSAGRVGAVGPLVHLLALSVAGAGVAAGRLTPGQLLATAAYLPMALGLLDEVAALAEIGAHRASARRLAEVLATPVPVPGDRPLPPGGGELRLRDVTVRAGDRTVLDGVDLVVPAGTSLAVVGRSGAGKSTLARVAGRLLDPDGGTVLLDGVPLDQLDPAALRAAVSHAFERPAPLGATVADAIGYGVDGIDRGRVVAAAVAARADGFVRRLPAGYDTPLDQAPLSGGERQRLGLARALARGGRLLVLDDATSSLDTVTEAEVGAALARAARDRTRVVVAHRAATAAAADRVAWLEAGRVRRVATHHELWADPGYRAVFAAERAPAMAGRP